jgi:Xaa-Pro aminopeptidase
MSGGDASAGGRELADTERLAIFSRSELLRRTAALRDAMQRLGIDAVLATSYPNSYYLSGAPIHPFGRPMVTVIPAEGEPAMVISIIEIEHVSRQSWIRDLRTYWDYNPKPEYDNPRPPLASLLVHLRDVLGERGLLGGRLGYEDATLPVRFLAELQSAFPAATFVPVSDVLDRQRLVLSEEELAILRAGDAIADIGQEVLIAEVRVGISARELSERARSAMLDAVLARHPGWPFALRVGVGLGDPARGAGHSEWTTWSAEDRVRPGQVLETVVDCIFWGYQGNVERAIVVGPLSDRVRRDYETMIEANERAIAMIRPGVTLGEVDAACKAVLSAAGHSTRSGSGLARGIVSYEGNHRLLVGDVRLYNDTPLVPNMAFSLEPDLQTQDGVYRHCNTIIVTEGGCEVDSRVRRDLIWIRD